MRKTWADRKNDDIKPVRRGLLFLALIDEAETLIRIFCARRGAAGWLAGARHDKICERVRMLG